MRGTPQQIIEKYLTLARDAQLSNDRVAEQAFFQHAEHYTRLLGEALREQAERQQHQQGQQGQQHHQQQYGRGDDQQPRNGDDGRDYNSPREDNGQHRSDAAQHRPEQAHDRREQPDMRPAPQPEAQHAEQPAAEAPVADAAVADAPPARNQRSRRPQIAALPDAVSTDEDSGEVRVDTPEEKAPARRARAPRNASAAPRTRRKPAADDAGVASADNGTEQG